MSAAAIDAGVATVHDESIRIHVVSTPPGADVLLAGKPIGTTPLDTQIKRGTGSAILTVHRARFADISQPVDLTASVTKDVTLVQLPDEPDPKQATTRPPPRPTTPHDRDHADRPPSHDAKPRATTPPAPKCQPPDRYNPFDTGCGGQPCLPCSK
jgi:hypothetical protein